MHLEAVMSHQDERGEKNYIFPYKTLKYRLCHCLTLILFLPRKEEEVAEEVADEVRCYCLVFQQIAAIQLPEKQCQDHHSGGNSVQTLFL